MKYRMHTHVKIKASADELVWAKNHSLGIYTPRLGYQVMSENNGCGANLENEIPPKARILSG